MIGLIAASVALAKGATVAPFEPYWVTGEYKGTTMCPICEYGMAPMVLIWTHGLGSESLKTVAKAIDEETARAPKRALFSFLIDANFAGRDEESNSKLRNWATSWNCSSISFLSRPASLRTTLKNYALEDSKAWTSVVYVVKGRKVWQTFLNPDVTDVPAIRSAIADVLSP